MSTMPLPTSGAPTPSTGGPNKVIVALAIVGGVLLLAVVAMVFLLIGRGTAEPSALDTATPTPTTTATDTPTPTPTPSASQTQAPVDNSTRFTNFTADLSVECDPTGQADKPEIQFSWTAANATQAWYAPQDQDAVENNYMQFPNPNAGTNNDLTDEHLFPCNHRQFMDMTITLVGPGGEHVSHHVIFEDVNWQG